MEKYGLYGKIIAQPGQRDAIVQVLLEAALHLEANESCELYIVNVSDDEPDTVWVTEIWADAAAHQASLEPEEVKALIRRTMPLIAAVEQVKLRPLGGKGL
jgi:quinol monooxygenase YgiN